MCSGVPFLPISGEKQKALCIHARTKVTLFPLLLIDALFLNFESQNVGPVGFGGRLESRLMIVLHTFTLFFVFPVFRHEGHRLS